jgi:DNA repair protein RadC
MMRADQLAAPVRFKLRTAADAIALLGDDLREAPIELLRLLHLDRAGELIALTGQSGSRGVLSLAFDRIVREICVHGSRRVLIAHNHPSGDPTPSRADHMATRRLAQVLRSLGIELVDHLIVARGGVTSFRQLGLL